MRTDEEKLIKEAREYARALFKRAGGSHDFEHTLRVFENAMKIAEGEPSCDRNLAGLEALLHDVDDHKLFSTENNANARAFLEAHGVSPEMTERICRDITSVSFSKNRGRRPETPEGRVVQDADRLDAMGAVGIARTFAYGGEKGRPLKDSVAHFHEKLLLLKDLMNTEAGRALAKERHAFMLSFLEELEKETGGM